MTSTPLVRLGQDANVWVRAGHVAAVRYTPAQGTIRSELEVEVVTGSVYRVYGADADRAHMALEDGSLGL